MKLSVPTKRLFLAIPLSPYFHDTFSQYQEQHPIQGVRFVPADNLHITVYFLGDVKETHIPKLDEKLHDAFTGIKPFTLKFEKISFGPISKGPRMIWAVYFAHDEYKKLVWAASGAAQEFVHQRHDRKNIVAHVTLARFSDPGAVAGIYLEQPPIETKTMPVSSCKLMESQLTPKGALYTVVYSYAIT